jgi:tRNA(adenine34) deaminase
MGDMSVERDHYHFMKMALAMAKRAARQEEVPVGALIVQEGRVVARAHNQTKARHDPTAHAEMIVLQSASQSIRNERLLNTVLYVTKEPCPMCAGAIVQARIPLVVFGARDPKGGACGSVLRVIPNKKLNHRPVVVRDVLGDEAAALLKEFFQERRGKMKSHKKLVEAGSND